MPIKDLRNIQQVSFWGQFMMFPKTALKSSVKIIKNYWQLPGYAVYITYKQIGGDKLKLLQNSGVPIYQQISEQLKSDI